MEQVGETEARHQHMNTQKLQMFTPACANLCSEFGLEVVSSPKKVIEHDPFNPNLRHTGKMSMNHIQ